MTSFIKKIFGIFSPNKAAETTQPEPVERAPKARPKRSTKPKRRALDNTLRGPFH